MEVDKQGNGTTDLPLILKEGVPKLVSEGKFPPSFTVKGQNFSFVIVAPQFNSYSYTADINAVIEFAKKNYRIDASRVYMTGLSMGATEIWNFAVNFPKSVTAMSLMSGVPTAVNTFAAKVAASGIPLWAFHNDKDDLFSVDTVKLLVSRINALKPVVPTILSVGVGGHDSWTKATDPAYKENNMNIYEWMLQYKNKSFLYFLPRKKGLRRRRGCTRERPMCYALFYPGLSFAVKKGTVHA